MEIGMPGVRAILLTLLGLSPLLGTTVSPGFDPNSACVGRSRLLAQAIVQYAQDYDEKLPPTDSVSAFQTALRPYVEDPHEFICPATGASYQPNAAISGRQITALGDPGTVPLFQDSEPHGDRRSTVAFLDTHIERGGVEQGDPDLLCAQHARQLDLAVLQYAQDHNEILPPMQTSAAFQTAIAPYVASQRDFLCPATHQPYTPNAALSGRSLPSIPGDPSTIVVLTDSRAHPDGVSTVAYLDGHAVHGKLVQPVTTSRGHINQIMLAVGQYVQDNNYALPPMQDYQAFETALSPYIHSQGVFLDPNSGLPYTLNTSLNGHSINDYPNPGQVEFLRDSARDRDGVLNVAYLDGHISQNLIFVPQTLAVGPDNLTHLLWRRADGTATIWTLAADGSFQKAQTYGPSEGRPCALSIGPDRETRLLWNEEVGANSLWTTSPAGDVLSTVNSGPYDGWTPLGLAVDTGSRPRLLWGRYNGEAAIWQDSPAGIYQNAVYFAPVPGQAAVALAAGTDNTLRLLWGHDNGAATLWTLSSAGALQQSATYTHSAGWTAVALAAGPDRQTRLLWDGGEDGTDLWTLSPAGKIQNTAAFSPGSGWIAAAVGVGADNETRLLWKNTDGRARLVTLDGRGHILSIHEFPPFS